MGKARFTKEQARNHMAMREAEYEKARGRLPKAKHAYDIQAGDFGAAFRQLIAQASASFGGMNVEYRFPDGSMVKVVCMEDARRKMARLERKEEP